MTPRPRRKPFNPHRWSDVRSRVWCGLGQHHVTAGRVRFLKTNYHGIPGSCAACLAKVGVFEPARSFHVRRR